MKIAYIKLINYIGIFNGLGLEEIEVNLTKATNRLILIRGLNGSGKTTLHSALSPIPESNDSIIKGKEGAKYVNILNKGYLYKIKILHPVKKNGDRDTIKAYIKKDNGGIETELNPNGNVTSYREIISNEFGLDPNFEALSKLSTDDKGIASKTPSERKRFANDILSELTAYNTIYKTISKRATMFKAMVNRLETKIEQIGDPESIKGSLLSIDNRLNNMNKERDLYNSKISEIIANIKIHDPDGTIQSRSDSLYIEIDEINSQIKSYYDELGSYANIVGNKDVSELSIKVTKLERELLELDMSISNLENVINTSLIEREKESAEIVSKNSKLQSIMNKHNHQSLITSINNLEEEIKSWDSILIEMGYDINGEINLTKDEYLLGINTLKEVKEIISTFRSAMDYEIIEKTIKEYIAKGDNPDRVYRIKNDAYPELTGWMVKNQSAVEAIEREIKMMDTLNLKPEECDMYHCQFIAEAYKIKESNPEDRLASAQEDLKHVQDLISKADIQIAEIKEILECYNYINRIIRLITSNNSILRKLPNNKGFSDKRVILDRILNNDPFDEIVELQKYVQYCDVFNIYNISKRKLEKLNSDLELYNSKEELMNEILSDIDKLNSNISSLDEDVDKFRKSIFEKKKERLNKSTDYENLKHANMMMTDIKLLEDKKKELLSSFGNIKNSIKIISELKDNLEVYSARVNSIENDLPSIVEDRDTLKYNLRQLEEYQSEYKEYIDKYSKIQEIKYHSSPTTGVQLLFIRLYMSNTINLANKLLGLLFDGEYFIEPFIINDREFRIPCRGSGFLNDDISSMSTGQISLISMVLSFVMLKQASTEYNILKLDEIDAGLDSINRVKFLNLLDKQMDMLDVEQCIMISHNPELDVSGCDFILLKMDESEKASIVNSGANIIYAA